MFWIVFTIIMLLLAGGLFLAARVQKSWVENNPSHRDANLYRGWARAYLISAWVVVAGAVVLLFACSFVSVSTKNVGIETSFGAISGELGNGAHLIAPWKSVTEMDAAVQTDSFVKQDCLSVRIANQQTACVDVSIRWRINPSKAGELFKNFRTFEHVRDSLVTRELTQAVNNQFSNYNPLNSVIGGLLPKGQVRNPSLSVIALRVTKQMREEIGHQIEILNTIIPIAHFDSQTQSRINQLQQQIALTRIAEQQKVTNKAQADANKKLAPSISNNPNVLVAQCLDILNSMVKTHQTIPAGFSCWPGSNKLTGVIASPTK
jgi:regulator of protease activity HflC (stomatin/prohibitin superfamily)